MGGASALLAGAAPRAAALAGLGAVLGCYYAWSASLWEAALWADVAFIGLVLTPAVFALVYLVLPLRRARGILAVGLALALLTWALEEADLPAVAGFSKLAAATAIGFWFAGVLDTVLLVAAVAFLIPWIDAYSVWRGPTEAIVEEHPEVFTTLSFALPVPGEENAARLGPPDLLFFALFLAAAARFGLRVRWTWAALVLSFGATLAIAVGAGSSGLPALPGLSLAFLGVNADLLWRAFRRARASA